jgi:hypothetical protein
MKNNFDGSTVVVFAAFTDAPDSISGEHLWAVRSGTQRLPRNYSIGYVFTMSVSPASETLTPTSGQVPDLPDAEHTHMREIAKSALFHKRYGRPISPNEIEPLRPTEEAYEGEHEFRNRYAPRTQNVKHYDHL